MHITTSTLRTLLLGTILLVPAFGSATLADDRSRASQQTEENRQTLDQLLEEIRRGIDRLIQSVPREDRIYARTLISIELNWYSVTSCLSRFYDLNDLIAASPHRVLNNWRGIDLRELDLLTEYCTKPLSSPVEMVVILKDNNRFEVDGEINGYLVRFLVDTGATDVSVPRNVADRIGLPHKNRITIRTAGGETRGWITRIRSLQIQGIYLPGSKLGPNGVHINANRSDFVLLGISALKNIGTSTFRDRMILRQSNDDLDRLDPKVREANRTVLLLSHVLRNECGLTDDITDDISSFHCAIGVLKSLPNDAFTEDVDTRKKYPLAVFLFP